MPKNTYIRKERKGPPIKNKIIAFKEKIYFFPLNRRIGLEFLLIIESKLKRIYCLTDLKESFFLFMSQIEDNT